MLTKLIQMLPQKRQDVVEHFSGQAGEILNGHDLEQLLIANCI